MVCYLVEVNSVFNTLFLTVLGVLLSEALPPLCMQSHISVGILLFSLH